MLSQADSSKGRLPAGSGPVRRRTRTSRLGALGPGTALVQGFRPARKGLTRRSQVALGDVELPELPPAGSLLLSGTLGGERGGGGCQSLLRFPPALQHRQRPPLQVLASGQFELVTRGLGEAAFCPPEGLLRVLAEHGHPAALLVDVGHLAG